MNCKMIRQSGTWNKLKTSGYSESSIRSKSNLRPVPSERGCESDCQTGRASVCKLGSTVEMIYDRTEILLIIRLHERVHQRGFSQDFGFVIVEGGRLLL
jgi:hypothetical protein